MDKCHVTSGVMLLPTGLTFRSPKTFHSTLFSLNVHASGQRPRKHLIALRIIYRPLLTHANSIQPMFCALIVACSPITRHNMKHLTKEKPSCRCCCNPSCTAISCRHDVYVMIFFLRALWDALLNASPNDANNYNVSSSIAKGYRARVWGEQTMTIM